MSLEDWRVYRNLTYQQLADNLQVSETTALRICKTGYCNKLVLAKKIVTLTGCKVTLDDLLPGE